MSDTRMERRRNKGVLLQTLLCWTLIGLCSARHRALNGGERPRHPRHPDRWAQRILFPSLNDQGTQQIEYPSVNDQGTQEVRYPSVPDTRSDSYPSDNDSAASSQIQKCAPGLYRDRSGSSLSRCVPCDCNGLSDECEDNTGRCLNCEYNTAGDRCERCKEGYYGNAAQRTCKACPCPFSQATNNFASGCREVFGEVLCICRTGYTGDRCEKCRTGYYGDPLSIGGRCRPCNCKGNGNNCDPKTGVCKNTLEPGDKDTDEHCQECDNCAQTLLKDLEKLDKELERIKSRLDNATTSGSSQEMLKKLEQDLLDTQNLVKKFSSTVNTMKSSVNQVELDTKSLSNDVSSLKDKADTRATDASKAVTEIGKTHKRAVDLDSDIKNMLKKIKELLDKLNDPSGDKPNDDLDKMLEDARRMVTEMEKRNLTPQKTAAVDEKDKAQKLLDYIKSNVSKQCDQNEAAAEKIQDLLKGYDDKLKDLDKAIKDAGDLVKKANAQNTLSSKAMGDLQKRIEDLKKERKTVEDQMALAEDELQKTGDLAGALSDSKTEYEELAAKLDGAKTDLTKKVNEISQAADKENIVKKAEDHAKKLAKLAKDLEDAVKDSSGRPEVRNAKDAIDAYKNITDAINAAEAAANKAKGAADNALDKVKTQKLPQRAEKLKTHGDELLREANKADNDLQAAADNLTDLKKRLNNADTKKKALQKDLLTTQDELNNIKRDDIGPMIDVAKTKAASANKTAGDTMDKLNDIKKDIDKISVTPGGSNLNSMLDDVDKTVKDLVKTIPSLTDKIKEVEDLNSEFDSLYSIRDNIKKLKELIELARDAANLIPVPMKFKGNGHVEMRPPKDLDDMRAYTAMVLKLQRPDNGRGDGRRRRQTPGGNMFVLYLGNRDSSSNYIGMFLRNNMLYCVYKLNGVEYEIETDSISPSTASVTVFDKVDLRRMYQDVKMSLEKDYSEGTNKPFEASKSGKETKNLLDLSPTDVVFYVGGYPADFTPPKSLQHPMYQGCIEFSSLNDKAVSLYNFQKQVKINEDLPCKRHVPSSLSKCFLGTGYGKVNIGPLTSPPVIKINIQSRSENGLLLFYGTEEEYFTLTVERGYLVLRGTNFPDVYKSTLKPFPLDLNKWPELFVVVKPNGDILVKVDRIPQIDTKSSSSAIKFESFYIGGAPQDMREKYNITMQPFKGCLQSFTLNGAVLLYNEEVGISTGCPEEFLTVRKAEFTPGSSLSSALTGFSLDSDATVSIGFKSEENQGVILKNNKQPNGMNIVLENGYVILNFKDKMWKSNKKYNDGLWHYLTATKRDASVMLMIDDEDTGKKESGSSTIPNTNGIMVLGGDTFKGCITNLYTRQPSSMFKADDLSYFKSSGKVFLDMCAADSPAQLMLDSNSKKR